MAFDGVVIANLIKELKETILNGRISKIAQPEHDELLLTIKGNSGQIRLALSASASLPLIYLTKENKPSPMTAPNFCMLLRKHIANGRITDICQPQMERIIQFKIEHLNELGDLCQKQLMIELMGKHSNIIFCDENYKIIDSIKHISAQVSSVREVLPGRTYFIPKTQEKCNPLETSQEEFYQKVFSKPQSLQKSIYTTYTGVSPVIASELCFRAGLEGDRPCSALSQEQKLHLFHHFSWMMEDVRKGRFCPNIIKNGKEPVEFAAVALTQYGDLTVNEYPDISKVLEIYYADKNAYTRIRQKSADLRKIISTILERNRKKYDLQLKQLKDTEKREKYKVYGELINTYGYNLEEGARQLTAENYYNGEMITIPLDPQLTPQENAKKYFDKYNKLKRTFEALTDLTRETHEETEHLESISTSLDIAVSEEDLTQIKEELAQYGYIRKKHTGKKEKIKSRPFHYLSSDGFHIYIGKNNFQNDDLTFKFAVGNDWWFHAKGMPGSHVIVKTNGEELPDRVFEEAGRLAAYYSKGRENDKVEIDYLEKKHVKKPNGSKPGFVVYYTNYSLVASPDISGLKLLSD
ncbi:MAG: fibronectin/fibrinogen-binding protein [Lachnospiraceae bacterium]|nr:fibronectin/fibrinogen-binding protein [Lachnospiraceae bacterium]